MDKEIAFLIMKLNSIKSEIDIIIENLTKHNSSFIQDCSITINCSYAKSICNAPEVIRSKCKGKTVLAKKGLKMDTEKEIKQMKMKKEKSESWKIWEG